MLIKSMPAYAARRPVFGVTSLIRTVVIWSNRRSQRQALADLSPKLQKDIGVTAAQRSFEVSKFFWQR